MAPTPVGFDKVEPVRQIVCHVISPRLRGLTCSAGCCSQLSSPAGCNALLALQASQRCGSSPKGSKTCRNSGLILYASNSLWNQERLILSGSIVLSAEIELFKHNLHQLLYTLALTRCEAVDASSAHMIRVPSRSLWQSSREKSCSDLIFVDLFPSIQC